MNTLLRNSCLIVGSLLLAGCANMQASPTPPSVVGAIKGYGISPLGFPADYSNLPAFLEEVGSLPNGGVMFNGAWRQDVADGSDAGEIPSAAILVVEQGEANGYTPIIVFGWRSEDSLHIGVPANPANHWANQEARALFKQMLVDFVSSYHPPYLFLGNESDAYFINVPEDYQNWIAFYNEAYDAIKDVSPETMVGPIFQYERLSGQGAFSQWTTPHWGALTSHDLERIDILGITMYPWLNVVTPSQVPDNYLAPLMEIVGDKPIAITETGWPGDPLGLPVAWEATLDAQLLFVERLDGILRGANIRMLNWLHLYQIAVTPESTDFAEFASISLRDAQGNKRPVYDAWINFQP
jgi:hypothetical protein